ncbi:hypothetical protein PAXRUDRAFT_162196, partial [Paxillus rubicundulus Ve08.2h10]
WRNGVLAVDGSAINLFAKPGLYIETFYDQKSNYSLNCQVSNNIRMFIEINLPSFGKLAIMLHHLLIVDYALGQLGSNHDMYAFQNTCIAKNHRALIPQGHWTWADMAYPTEKWCVIPDKNSL